MPPTPRSPAVASESAPAPGGVEKKKPVRTRSGCLVCRRKKRKCDEARPCCARCSRTGETCEWGLRVSFRSMTMPDPPRSPPATATRARPARRKRRFEIVDVTESVIKECEDERRVRGLLSPDEEDVSIRSSVEPEGAKVEPLLVAGHGSLGTPREISRPDKEPSEARGSSMRVPPRSASTDATETAYHVSTPQQTEHAAANLLSLRSTVPMDLGTGMFSHDSGSRMGESEGPRVDMFSPEELGYALSDDGLFLPGSAYLDLHSTLRDHLMQEGRSNGPTRHCTPCDGLDSDAPLSIDIHHPLSEDALFMDREQEGLLWRNWLNELSPWLDKFDHKEHFRLSLPILAKSTPHLRFSIMAVSARQLERLHGSRSAALRIPSSLALYQQAIHLLLPQLATRSTAVIASCVVLCVLEMLSCSPKAWQRHLDGCATLLQAVGVHGFSGGVDQALFWCFARMDVVGSLISSVQTLIPVSSWTPSVDLQEAIRLFQLSEYSDMYANQAVFLMAQVTDLLQSALLKTTPALFVQTSRSDADVAAERRWCELWDYIDDWYTQRPGEMHPIHSWSDGSGFPTILFSNPAAISGNQMYHTAALLMLQHRPHQVHLPPQTRSVLWHARRIVAISMSNDHHGCWTNSLQPLYIAGRCFSSPQEHRAVLGLLARIERESGWATAWRANDLREWWGDLDD